MAKVNFTTPVGRLVMGSLYKPQTTDADGKPLTIKNGPNVGQPTVRFFFAVAIPKKPGEQHWSQTEWGAKILAVGQQAFPQGQWQQPTFAWKIIDGDSQVPNSKGKKPCDREGYPGHWVISFSSGFAPKIYNADGSAAILEPDAVKLGYYVQVNGDVDGNMNAMKPGIYINHSMVALSAYGEEIHVGPDATQAGFGGAPLPPGASMTPVAGFAPPAAPLGTAPAGVPQQPAFPGGTATPVSPSSVPPAAPNYQFLGAAPGMVPAAPGMMPAMPAPVPPQARVMTALAKGATYEQMIAAGWTDDLLRALGMMVG